MTAAARKQRAKQAATEEPVSLRQRALATIRSRILDSQYLPGELLSEVRLAEDGEVLCRGGNIFRGYLDDPERTAEVMSGEWFHTGDIGVLDEDGLLE